MEFVIHWVDDWTSDILSEQWSDGQICWFTKWVLNWVGLLGESLNGIATLVGFWVSVALNELFMIYEKDGCFCLTIPQWSLLRKNFNKKLSSENYAEDRSKKVK